MKVKIIDINKKEKGTVDLPAQFNEIIKPSVIKKVFLAIQNNKRQKYGANPEAGKRYSAKLSKRRRAYRGSYGIGISRVPRKIMSRRGTRMNWVGALVPGTVGGRRAHPPKSEKNWDEKINKKENRLAIRSAISATIIEEYVKERGHRIPRTYPFIIDNKIETIDKTKKAVEILKNIELNEELQRVSKKKTKSGKGKLRGRRKKDKIGPLIVVSKDCPLIKSVKNIPGIEISIINQLNVELLAPGAQQGRLTIFTEESIKRLKQEKLFM